MQALADGTDSSPQNMEQPTGCAPTTAEPILTVAEAWAKKKREAVEKAARVRALRAENSLGGGSGLDFLSRLGAAEQRDDERAGSTRVKLAQPPRAPSPMKPHTLSPARRPLKASSSKSSVSKRREAHATAKVALQQHLKAKAVAQGKNAGSDPSRSLPALGYEVLNPIAAGAFSTILRCRVAATGDVVAVKSFDTLKCAKDVDVGEARDRELEVLRLLRDAGSLGDADGSASGSSSSSRSGAGHAHIANMLAEFGDGAAPHVHAVLQYAEGGSLKRYLHTQQHAMPPRLVSRATMQLASALAHLHSLGVAHRDIKPANVLLCSVPISAQSTGDSALVPSATPNALGSAEQQLHLKLCDFGFATLCGNTRLKLFCGTPSYVAPEIASPADAHKGYLGRPVDMWAFGCVVYEMLHGGRPAFKCEERFELEGLIRRCNHQPIERRVPQGAKALLAGLLVANPATRLTALQVLYESPWTEAQRRTRTPRPGAESLRLKT